MPTPKPDLHAVTVKYFTASEFSPVLISEQTFEVPTEDLDTSIETVGLQAGIVAHHMGEVMVQIRIRPAVE